MGPDLTGAYTKLGEAVIAWPESVSPMKEIYSDKPLTPEEKEDLLAFLRSADVTQRSPRAVGWLALWAVAGAAVVLVAAQLVWRRRLSKVRGPMTKG